MNVSFEAQSKNDKSLAGSFIRQIFVVCLIDLLKLSVELR